MDKNIFEEFCTAIKETGKYMREDNDNTQQQKQQEELQQIWEAGVAECSLRELTEAEREQMSKDCSEGVECRPVRLLKTKAAEEQDRESIVEKLKRTSIPGSMIPPAVLYTKEMIQEIEDREALGICDFGCPPGTHKVEGVNPKDLIGAKKVDIALVPPSAIVEMAKCMQDGANKYGAYNWREEGKPVQAMTYLSAALRHLLAYIDGEDCAQDSGHSHLAHVMAGLAVYVDAVNVNNNIDNRPIKGKAGEMLK